jgi:hypothetical protein
MDARHVFIGVLFVALASPAWGQTALDDEPSAGSLDKSYHDGNAVRTGSACTDCFENPSFCNMCPCTYGEIEWVFMKRCAGLPDRALLIDANTQETLVSSSDLDFDFSPGVRALFGFRLWGCRAVEFGYFGLADSRSSIDFVQPNPAVDVTLPGSLGIASNVFHGDVRVRIDYLSRLQGAEVNFPCCCSSCCCSAGCSDCGPSCSSGSPNCGPATSLEWFVGFRYLSLREDLRISGARTVDTLDETGFYDTTSRNDLFGAQLGGRIRRCYGRFSWEATGKAGIFGNSAGQEQVFVDYPGFLLRPTTGANGGNVAFVGELDLTGIYQINQTWGLRLGYSLMFIDGVALAPSQTDFTFTSTSGTALNTNGNLFLHGVNVGLEARW